MCGKALPATVFIILCCVSFVCAGTPQVFEATSVCADGGMVVTACPIASWVGRAVMERGGNAVDAAVAVGFTLAVTYPAAGNIGGGGFMLVRSQAGAVECIDFRETAPLAASRDMYLDGGGSVIGCLSTLGHRAVGVPGSVAGLFLAHERYGTVPWGELLDYAITLAAEGFGVSRRLAESLARLQAFAGDYPELKTFMRSDGSPLAEGDLLRQSDLARTLHRIAEHGPDEFYRGETAAFIVREMARGGGLINEADLERYRAVIREPVRGSYRGYDIISAPPPSSGGTVLIEILNILEGFPLAEYGFLTEKTMHYVVEAERIAYADRAQHLGDPDYIDAPVSVLISKEYADRARARIGNLAADSERLRRGLVSTVEHGETTHYSIVDSQGNAAAVTTTLNGSFGSKVVVSGAGFLLNNEMDDFVIKPDVPNMYGLTGGDANAIAPAKRMLSSMTPTIIESGGELFLLLGTPGGSTIITTVCQLLLDIIDFDKDAAEAVAAPRFHHQWLPDVIDLERGAFSEDLTGDLKRRGHACRERVDPIGDVQLIMVRDSLLCGVSDPRGGGEARGLAGSDAGR